MRNRANKALKRLRARINFWKAQHASLRIRYLETNDLLGNALFREKHYLEEELRLKGLMWRNGKVVSNGIR